MKYGIIELSSQTATFRNPEFQNFHKTLLLPPPTTIMGMIGAALGLSPKATQSFFDEDDFKMGIYATTNGKARDLWKYNDFKTGSIIIREILFKNQFIIVIGNADEAKIQKIIDAVLHPKYALTLGSSDSLVWVKNCAFANESTKGRNVEKCLLEGDIISEVFENAELSTEFSIYTTSEPIALDIPTKFEYKDDYGIRNVVERKTLSFVSKKMKLNVDKEGISYNGHFIPLFNL